ncbi:hypothetical protein, partial [Sphingopyxis alaskensis]|uniref:hypothetical protein n=1 Tax=Sphingopyxis alaskensis TaxID=117207 RepID=UPI0020404F5C
SSVEGVEMLCLWRLTFNQERRSLDGFTSTKAPIHAVVRATARFSDIGGLAGWVAIQSDVL